jgi:nucleoside-diphosphate-sugar epimerase
MTMNVFVTGATGVLGRRVVKQLIVAGHSVSGVARSEAKAEELRAAGAKPVVVDLFDGVALRKEFDGHDVVANLATSIPTGLASANPRAWRPNDRLRRDASAVIAAAVTQVGVGRMIQESITFPYVACGSDWILEDTKRTYFPLNKTVLSAEASTSSVTVSGAQAVVLRFAMFMAPESGHMNMVAGVARKGLFGLVGNLDDYISFIHADDAGAAVVAALSIPAGTYNVAEQNPSTRSAHRDALTKAVNRAKLRTVPALGVKLGGAGAESIARSHRISSQLLQSVSPWRPQIHCLDTWAEMRIDNQ